MTGERSDTYNTGRKKSVNVRLPNPPARKVLDSSFKYLLPMIKALREKVISSYCPKDGERPKEGERYERKGKKVK